MQLPGDYGSELVSAAQEPSPPRQEQRQQQLQHRRRETTGWWQPPPLEPLRRLSSPSAQPNGRRRSSVSTLHGAPPRNAGPSSSPASPDAAAAAGAGAPAATGGAFLDVEAGAEEAGVVGRRPFLLLSATASASSLESGLAADADVPAGPLPRRHPTPSPLWQQEHPPPSSRQRQQQPRSPQRIAVVHRSGGGARVTLYDAAPPLQLPGGRPSLGGGRGGGGGGVSGVSVDVSGGFSPVLSDSDGSPPQVSVRLPSKGCLLCRSAIETKMSRHD